MQTVRGLNRRICIWHDGGLKIDYIAGLICEEWLIYASIEMFIWFAQPMKEDRFRGMNGITLVYHLRK